MATATPYMRYIHLILLLWFIHQTQTISVQPLVISSSLDDYFFTPTGRSAFNDRKYERENSHNSGKERRSSNTNPRLPPEPVSRFLEAILDTRHSQHPLYNELGFDLRQRLESIVRDISNLIRTTSNQYRRRQRKNAKWVGFIRDNSARNSKWSQKVDLEEVYNPDPAELIGSKEMFSPGRFLTSPELSLSQHLPYPPQMPPTQQLSVDNLPSDQPRAERMIPHYLQQPPVDISDTKTAPHVTGLTSLLPYMESSTSNTPPLPPWRGSELPPSLTVQVIDANFHEVYNIAPAPNYHLLNLLTDLLSRPTHPLDIRVNKTGDCLFIENIDGIGPVDEHFEWRIVVNNRQDEEIWNSQCMPPETLKLRFGYDVIFAYVMRYGLPEQGELSQDKAGGAIDEDLEETFLDMLEV